MARRLDQFPNDARPAHQKYPWSEWTDGSVWEIRRGVDYDVATENMRVNLHMKADAHFRKVRTKKITDDQGEGLIFQFTNSDKEEMKMIATAASNDPDGLRQAIEQLYADAIEIYERARAEVTIPRSDGTRQKYAPVRYKQQIDKAYAEDLLVPMVAHIIRKPTLGFGHLADARRPDLMLEALVIDPTKPYHHLFAPKTIEIARKRMADYDELVKAEGDI